MGKEALLNHIALQCSDSEKAKIFFTEILGLHLEKKFVVSKELSEIIFGIIKDVEVEVYGNDRARFEVFIIQTEENHGYEHVCMEIDDKKEFIECCKKYDVKPIIIDKNGKNLLFVKDFSGNLFEIKEKQIHQ